MAFLAVCTLHTVLSAETIPKNASGIIIWSTISDICYEKIKDKPLAELYKNHKIALFIPADKITAYYWKEQVFTFPWSYVRSIMKSLYVMPSQSPSFFSFLIGGHLIFTGINRCHLIDSVAGIPEAQLNIPFLLNIMVYTPPKEYTFFTFAMGYIHVDISSQTFYESRKNRNIYYEPLYQYFSKKKKDYRRAYRYRPFNKKRRNSTNNCRRNRKKLNYKPEPDKPIEYNTE